MRGNWLPYFTWHYNFESFFLLAESDNRLSLSLSLSLPAFAFIFQVSIHAVA